LGIAGFNSRAPDFPPVGTEEAILSVRIAEVQLLLAEKRTSLAILRAGMGIFLLPLSLFTALIATSRFYDVGEVLALIITVVGVSLALMGLGAWLIWRSIRRIRRIDHKIAELKQRSDELKHLYYDGEQAMDGE
jgi:uncharacterized membrane protein YidH (DUF202 family)